jgi:FeS assembly SUF system protein
MKSIPLVPPEMSEAAAAETPPPDLAAFVPDPAQTDVLKPKIVDAISTVYDPEIPVNIWELGLIYEILADASGVVVIRMTLTAPGCPAAQSLPVEVAEKVKAVAGVADATVDVVWDPPWSKDRMSEAAKLQLGLW